MPKNMLEGPLFVAGKTPDAEVQMPISQYG